MQDYVKEFLEKSGTPVTRKSYIDLNWANTGYDSNKMLPAELEADLPEELQIKGTGHSQN
jgi:hypothetical protein